VWCSAANSDDQTREEDPGEVVHEENRERLCKWHEMKKASFKF
jgi:hypothetical protein